MKWISLPNPDREITKLLGLYRYMAEQLEKLEKEIREKEENKNGPKGISPAGRVSSS